jgi:hypothetical protein
MQNGGWDADMVPRRTVESSAKGPQSHLSFIAAPTKHDELRHHPIIQRRLIVALRKEHIVVCEGEACGRGATKELLK